MPIFLCLQECSIYLFYALMSLIYKSCDLWINTPPRVVWTEQMKMKRIIAIFARTIRITFVYQITVIMLHNVIKKTKDICAFDIFVIEVLVTVINLDICASDILTDFRWYLQPEKPPQAAWGVSMPPLFPPSLFPQPPALPPHSMPLPIQLIMPLQQPTDSFTYMWIQGYLLFFPNPASFFQ